MSTISDIREGFETLVGGITDLRVYAYEPDGVLEYPCLVLEPTEDQDFLVGALGDDDMRFDLMGTLYLHIQDSGEGWKELDEYRSSTGTKSIRARVKTDVTLGGTVDYAEVISVGNASRDKEGNQRFWEFSCEFRTQIIKNVA